MAEVKLVSLPDEAIKSAVNGMFQFCETGSKPSKREFEQIAFTNLASLVVARFGKQLSEFGNLKADLNRIHFQTGEHALFLSRVLQIIDQKEDFFSAHLASAVGGAMEYRWIREEICHGGRKEDLIYGNLSTYDYTCRSFDFENLELIKFTGFERASRIESDFLCWLASAELDADYVAKNGGIMERYLIERGCFLKEGEAYQLARVPNMWVSFQIRDGILCKPLLSREARKLKTMFFENKNYLEHPKMADYINRVGENLFNDFRIEVLDAGFRIGGYPKYHASVFLEIDSHFKRKFRQLTEEEEQ